MRSITHHLLHKLPVLMSVLLFLLMSILLALFLLYFWCQGLLCLISWCCSWSKLLKCLWRRIYQRKINLNWVKLKIYSIWKDRKKGIIYIRINKHRNFNFSRVGANLRLWTDLIVEGFLILQKRNRKRVFKEARKMTLKLWSNMMG